VSAFVEDAAHVPGGHAAGVTSPASEAEIVDALHSAPSVLAVGAQSSLTGGATPMGELVISTAKLNRISEISVDTVRLEPGVALADLDAALERAGRLYPPAPTFFGAFIGGTVATNAAGAATFKYGSTRHWVQALTVVLATGDVLDLERGQVTAHPDGYFDIELTSGTARVPVPRYRMPDVPKVSAGYFAAPGMDLIDLFIGSEGTLGIISSITVRVVPRRPPVCLAFVPFADRSRALALVGHLREAARETWRTGDADGIDVAAIEHLDARSLAIVREDGADRQSGIALNGHEAMALLVTIELPGIDAAAAYAQIERAVDPGAADGALVRFCRLLEEFGALDDVAIAVPGDRARAAQLIALREAVPDGVNRRVRAAQRGIDRRIEKTAADMIVPFERFGELLTLYETEFGSRGLDVAIWGHISDGNVHPNVIPRSYVDVESGREAILRCGRAVIDMGGSPLAEHGVGRSPVKQQLFEMLYGPEGIEDMRRVKRALDPAWKLAPGVLFGSRF
jgi:D-lactate dehydrogenase (cytochrome)